MHFIYKDISPLYSQSLLQSQRIPKLKTISHDDRRWKRPTERMV